jgi:hypothetical protein
MKTNYSAEIANTIESYKAYRAKCIKLESKALELLENTIFFDYDFSIFCSYIPLNGLSFTFDFNDNITGEITTSCTKFFHLFKNKKLGEITIEDIKSICY